MLSILGRPGNNLFHYSALDLANAALELAQISEPLDLQRIYKYSLSLLYVLYLKLSLRKVDIGVSVHNNNNNNYSTTYAPVLFHGKMDRCRAEQILSVGVRGTFLFRLSESSGTSLVLSVTDSRYNIVHIKIVKQNGLFILGGNSPLFPDVQSIVTFYQNNCLPLKSYGVKNLKLLIPAVEKIL